MDTWLLIVAKHIYIIIFKAQYLQRYTFEDTGYISFLEFF